MSERELTPEEVVANVGKADAEARKADAEARKADAEARAAAAAAEETETRLVKARNDAAREADKRAEELAADKYHHIYLLDTEISDSSVKKCTQQLATWERTAAAPLTVDLVLNSPGGSIVDGFALIDFIAGMRSRGHTVNTTAYGMAASMAGVVLQAGATRSMGTNAVLLIHEASFMAVGSWGEVQDRVKLVDIFHERILKLFTDRAHVSKSFIKRNWTRKDWWLDSATSLKHGFVDQVV